MPAAVPLRARFATFTPIIDAHGRLIDEGLALFFAAPASATGEDVLELHVHGSPIVAEAVLSTLLAAGARLAQPGEFTRRAFLAGKLDLSAAESVADLIAAESLSAARAAAGRLAGGLAAVVGGIRHKLQALLEELAAAVDYPDEVPDPSPQRVATALHDASKALDDLIAGGQRGRLVREGASVAIVGPPNAGKSSLLNALLNDERAIVSPQAGTTRDTIEESFEIDGLAIRLIDTAGIRSEADSIEAIGIERTYRALQHARLVLAVFDGSQTLPPPALRLIDETAMRERILFFNKADIGQAGVPLAFVHQPSAIIGSVYEAETLSRLRRLMRRLLIGETGLADLERPSLARTREIDAAIEARRNIDAALMTLRSHEPIDLLYGDIHLAVAALGKITGDAVTEAMLDGIFARFCIGK